MGNRKLSEKQQQRITENQSQRFCDIDNDKPIDTSNCNGRIISHFGQQLDVEILNGDNVGVVIRCHYRANLPTLVTGDLVKWEADTKDVGVIVSRSVRKNTFGRHDSNGTFKPVAANLNRVLIVFAVIPTTFMNLIDRYLVAVENLKIQPLLVLNKIDLFDNSKNRSTQKLLAIYKKIGYPIIEVSAETGQGIYTLQKALSGQTTVLVGQSGVGKSSLINRLGLEKLTETAGLSKAKDKGVHTTTTSRLYHLETCDLIDSPGIREFSLSSMPAQNVLKGFRELNEFSLACKYTDCRHGSEPGCAIQQAIKSGNISLDRFESYQHILNDLT